ncbi:MAG: carbohydrate binding domain-containing protein [Bacteroidales bacterium]|nr:carbohydrate binding domain-containing protein [Bacteroidales bacterium]
MKKFTFLVAAMATVVSLSAQNLLKNGSFETWTAGAPDSWTITTPANGAAEANTTLKMEGVTSLKAVGGTGTYSIYQVVPVTPGKSYTLYMSYYIEGGDGTDARIWSNFKNGTAYLTDAEMTAGGLLEKLKGPGGSAATFYFPDVKGAWQTYTVDFVAPAGVTDFNMEFRTYKTPAVVYWDDMKFGETGTLGITNNKFDSRIFVNDGVLNLANVAAGTSVEVFNSVGKRVNQGVTSSNKYDLSKLSKGMYIVRVGNITKKITL